MHEILELNDAVEVKDEVLHSSDISLNKFNELSCRIDAKEEVLVRNAQGSIDNNEIFATNIKGKELLPNIMVPFQVSIANEIAYNPATLVVEQETTKLGTEAITVAEVIELFTMHLI